MHEPQDQGLAWMRRRLPGSAEASKFDGRAEIANFGVHVPKQASFKASSTSGTIRA